MNAIIFSAAWGIVMMFSGVFIKNKTTPKYLAVVGIMLLFVTNGIELYQAVPFFNIDTMHMLKVNSFNLLF